MILTKEDYEKIIKDIKIRRQHEKAIYEKLKEITNMCDDLNLTQKGTFTFNFDTEQDKILIKFEGSDRESLILYEHPNYDLLWDTSSWEIAKREIKDVFFEVRRNLKEKETNKKNSWWEKIKNFFSI
jgi:hypothetical protein